MSHLKDIFEKSSNIKFHKIPPPEGAQLLRSTTPPRPNNGYANASQHKAAHKQSCYDGHCVPLPCCII